MLLHILLLPLSMLYGLVVWLRNRKYDRGKIAAARFEIPLIAVGNLCTGGAGKTPMVEYLLALLQDQYNLAMLSRGYKRKTRGFQLAGPEADAGTIGDEPLQVKLKFPSVVVGVSEDRKAGIKKIRAGFPATQAVVLDDAFQHRSIKPGLNILLTYYHDLFYKDRLLPAGTLREPASGYRRADIIIVTKCPEGLAAAQQNKIISGINPLRGQKVYFSSLQYGALYDFYTGAPFQLTTDHHVFLLAAIRHLHPIYSYLKKNVASFVQLTYKDHHYFSKRDIKVPERYVRH